MKLFFKIILYIFLVVCLGLCLFITYIISDYNSSYDQNDISTLIKNAKISESLPQGFIDVYYEINENHNTKSVLFNTLFNNRFKPCPCLELGGYVSHISKTNNRLLANKYVVAMKLEKQLTQENCLSYLTERYDFCYQNKGIRQASNYYFNKAFNSLNNKEYASLVMMMKNPSLYNPKKQPRRLEWKLKTLGFE